MGARRREEEGGVTRRVLGIDLASARWSSVGSATIDFEDEAFTRVVAGAIAWPTVPLTPGALADAIDAFARREGVCAVALDGPQGWRDPATAEGMRGVGRRCEYECRTQGKTGAYPRTFPGTQRKWIEFSIDVFARLLARPGVALADPAAGPESRNGYVILECFPTSAWRSSGLAALPGKSRRPVLTPYWSSLRAVYSLPDAPVSTHDDLQAVVAALTAAAAARGPAVADTKGVPGTVFVGADGTQRRIEGFIWDVKPLVGQRNDDVLATTTLRARTMRRSR